MSQVTAGGKAHPVRASDFRPLLGDTLRAYGSILFVGDTATGAVCLLATLLNLRAGLAGLTATLLAGLILRLLNLNPLIGQLVRGNALLVGLALGTLIPDWTRLPPYLLAGVLLSTLTSTVLADWCWRLDRFNPLSLPFVVSATALTAIAGAPGLPHHLPFAVASLALPPPIAAFAQALGAAYFAPAAPVGLLLFLALLSRSRYLALLAVAGFAAGRAVITAVGLSLPPDIGHWVGFNWILATMAVGGIYTVPSRRSFALALVTAVLTGLITLVARPWLADLGLPAMACPFLFTTTLVLVALRKRTTQGDPILTLERPDLPEVNHERLRLARFRGEAYDRPLLRPPFRGAWQVYQGFNGKLSHQPPWQYAADFIQLRDGFSFRGSGEALSDYHCFGQPILSPVWGQVVAVENSCPDNPPGTLDTERNWGNHVMIRVHEGCHVLLAHFQRDSCRVSPGQAVRPGDPLGRCGNSGRSAQPHLHLHVQTGAQLGDSTRPFALCGVERVLAGAIRHHLYLEPDAGMRLQAPAPLSFRDILGFQAGREFRFLVRRGRGQWKTELRVEVDLLGHFRLHSNSGASLGFVDSGVALALFDRRGPKDWLVDALALSLGLIPHGVDACTWEDRPPIGLLPLTAGERIFAAMRYPLGTGIQSLYQREPGTRGDQWHLIASHQSRLLPWAPLEVETRAVINRDLGLRELGLYRDGRCLLHASLDALGGAGDTGVPAWQTQPNRQPRRPMTGHLSCGPPNAHTLSQSG